MRVLHEGGVERPYIVDTGIDRGGGAGMGLLGVGYQILHVKICVFRHERHPATLAFIKQTMTTHAECMEERTNA